MCHQKELHPAADEATLKSASAWLTCRRRIGPLSQCIPRRTLGSLHPQEAKDRYPSIDMRGSELQARAEWDLRTPALALLHSVREAQGQCPTIGRLAKTAAG